MTCLSRRLYTSSGKLPIEAWVGCSAMKTVIKLLSLPSDEKIFQIPACASKWHDFTLGNVSLRFSKNVISQGIERWQSRNSFHSMRMKWTNMNKRITNVWSRAWIGLKKRSRSIFFWNLERTILRDDGKRTYFSLPHRTGRDLWWFQVIQHR